MTLMAWGLPLVLFLLGFVTAMGEAHVNGGTWRLPRSGGSGTIAWAPAIVFAHASDVLRSREDYRAGLRLLVLGEILLVLAHALLAVLFRGTFGAVLGFAAIAAGMTAFGAFYGFVNRKEGRSAK